MIFLSPVFVRTCKHGNTKEAHAASSRIYLQEPVVEPASVQELGQLQVLRWLEQGQELHLLAVHKQSECDTSRDTER